MLSAAEQGIHAIVVERLDRLARDLKISELILESCRKESIKVFVVEQGTLVDMASDEGDPTRTFIRQILGAVAQWQKTELVRKLAGARARIRLQKGKCEGPKFFGRNPQERAAKTLIHSLKAVDYTYEKIAEILNQEGFRTRFKTLWSEDRIKRYFYTERQAAREKLGTKT